MQLMAAIKRKRTVSAPLAPKAERVQVTLTLNAKLSDRVDDIAREKGWNRSELFDRMAEFYLTHQNQNRN